MIDPLAPIRLKTQEEKNALLAKRRAEWNAIPADLRDRVAASEDDFTERYADMIEVEKAPFNPARDLTADELVEQNGSLMYLRLYGDRASDPYDGLPDALREVAKAQHNEAVAKITAPLRRSESLLQSLVRQALEKVLEKRTIPMRESERPGLEIHPVMHEMARDDSDAGRFIRAWIANDTAGMREIAHSLAAA